VIDRLYDRIGGAEKINAAVEIFYRRVLEDEGLRHFFEGVEMKHLRARQSMFLSMLTGGKTVYTGKQIRTAHAGARAMGMDDAHFDALLAHFGRALRDVGVSAEAVTETMTLLERVRGDVLDRS
jgi:truncated hemoglobin YjbI